MKQSIFQQERITKIIHDEIYRQKTELFDTETTNDIQYPDFLHEDDKHEIQIGYDQTKYDEYHQWIHDQCTTLDCNGCNGCHDCYECAQDDYYNLIYDHPR